jgi:NADPH:quinone reductase-like Zn-dependent oxidoreductase
MLQVFADRFGGPDVLRVAETPMPEPGRGEVRVALTSIGMNHADLMARRGEYKISSGMPPFTPGLEGGGVIDAVGAGVTDRHPGQRVLIDYKAPRRPGGGTYRSHYILPAANTIPAPVCVPDEQLGAIWLAYLTAWGCLVWKQRLQAGQIVAFPAASSAVALAAAQIARKIGATTIGLTSNPDKLEILGQMPEAAYDHLRLAERDAKTVRGALPWLSDLRKLSAGRGIDLFFDAVAAGAYLQTEILSLATGGTIWIYGLLGEAGKVDVTPLIRKQAAIRGWLLGELAATDEDALQAGYRQILDSFESGRYRQRVARTFRLADVVSAHEEMERGEHIGKMVLVP